MTVIQFPYGQTRASWLAQCIMTDGRNPLPFANVSNALTGLRSDPFLAGILTYDEFACTPTVVREIGGGPHEPRKIDDDDITNIQSFLQHAGLKGISKEIVHQAILRHAADFKYHPVRDYLGGLLWDGTLRVERWLIEFAGWEDTPYSRAVGKMFLIALAARIFEPGCQADYMIVLEGPQGKQKSSLLKQLAHPWFSDALPDISSKDASIYLRGVWLIEIAEMHTFTKAETTQLKSYITRRIERYRPPYLRHAVDEPRQCVFAGTTNKDTYLKDETGARRYHPGRCVGKIDVDGLAEVRDQLMAEAVHLYHERVHWWPDPEFEQTVIKPQQDERYDADAWEDLIIPWLGNLKEVTLPGVACGALGYQDPQQVGDYDDRGGNSKTPLNRLGTADQNRVKAILKNHGFIRSKRRSSTGRALWVRP